MNYVIFYVNCQSLQLVSTNSRRLNIRQALCVMVVKSCRDLFSMRIHHKKRIKCKYKRGSPRLYQRFTQYILVVHIHVWQIFPFTSEQLQEQFLVASTFSGEDIFLALLKVSIYFSGKGHYTVTYHTVYLFRLSLPLLAPLSLSLSLSVLNWKEFFVIPV